MIGITLKQKILCTETSVWLIYSFISATLKINKHCMYFLFATMQRWEKEETRNVFLLVSCKLCEKFAYFEAKQKMVVQSFTMWRWFLACNGIKYFFCAKSVLKLMWIGWGRVFVLILLLPSHMWFEHQLY